MGDPRGLVGTVCDEDDYAGFYTIERMTQPVYTAGTVCMHTPTRYRLNRLPYTGHSLTASVPARCQPPPRDQTHRLLCTRGAVAEGILGYGAHRRGEA